MKKHRNALAVVLMCVWAMISVIAVQFLIGWILISIIGRDALNQPVWTAVYSALSYVAALLLVVLVPRKFIKISKNNLGMKDWPTWTDIGLAPVAFVLHLLLALVLVAIFSSFPWFDANEAQDVGFSIYMSGGDRIIAFITLVIIAPIAEEILFRGWLYGNIRERLNGKLPDWAGILLSIFLVSLVFGMVHLQWNVGVNVFCLSVVLCALREVTGTIYSGILTHMLKNGVAFYLLYVLGM